MHWWVALLMLTVSKIGLIILYYPRSKKKPNNKRCELETIYQHLYIQYKLYLNARKTEIRNTAPSKRLKISRKRVKSGREDIKENEASTSYKRKRIGVGKNLALLKDFKRIVEWMPIMTLLKLSEYTRCHNRILEIIIT